MSERHALVDSVTGDELRRRPYGNYGIYYEIEDDHVMVLRVLNAARDLGPLFGRD